MAQAETTNTASNVIDASQRFRDRRRQVKDARANEFEALCKRHPHAVVAAVLTAVATNSEVPLHLLPSPYRERCIAAFRQGPQP
jgi:hypothetical protein